MLQCDEGGDVMMEGMFRRGDVIEYGTYTTESISTSPPKYRDKSQKWVPCSMTGPISIDLFHHAGLAIAS
jgi:hypothetical protein